MVAVVSNPYPKPEKHTYSYTCSLTKKYPIRMLDHPITVVLNVFDTLKNNWLKVYKFMCIQTQEDHISQI